MEFSDTYLRIAGLVNQDKYKNKPYGHANGVTAKQKFKSHVVKCHGGDVDRRCLACRDLYSAVVAEFETNCQNDKN